MNKYDRIKRILDIFCSLVAIIVLSPVLVVVMVVLKLTGEKQVLFNQPRIGLNQKEFKVHKFVTMRKGSEKVSTITEKNDPRVLPFGKFLRLAKINELPQFFNILKGQMSIVGPRPLSPDNFQAYPSVIRSELYMGVSPGLTGIGSVLFRHEEEIMYQLKKEKNDGYKEDIMPVKGAAELWYRDHRSLWLDLKIIALTAISVVAPNNTMVFRVFEDTQFINDYLQLPVFEKQRMKG